MNKKQIIPIAIALVLVGALAALLWQNHQQKQDIEAMSEMMEFEKERLADEYEDLAMQYDGYQINLQNDSLVERLAQEQQRVQELLEELRITKATDARKIAALKQELATVRAVMKQYVAQIDSLNRENAVLTQENKEVRQQNRTLTEEKRTLTEEKTRLAEVVNRAAMMEIEHFSYMMLDKRDKKITRFNKMQKLQINFDIAKNITTSVGMKTLYVRLVQPDGEVLLKKNSGQFSFEGGKLDYSLRHEFEYAGDATSATLYWPVEEVLQPGIYNVDFFIDGSLCGSFPMHLK